MFDCQYVHVAPCVKILRRQCAQLPGSQYLALLNGEGVTQVFCACSHPPVCSTTSVSSGWRVHSTCFPLVNVVFVLYPIGDLLLAHDFDCRSIQVSLLFFRQCASACVPNYA